MESPLSWGSGLGPRGDLAILDDISQVDHLELSTSQAQLWAEAQGTSEKSGG